MKKENEPNLPCQPIGELVLVELVTGSVSDGGIHLPEKQVKHGYVRAIGGGVDKKFLPREETNSETKKFAGLYVGAKVLLTRGGTGMQVGPNYVLMSPQLIAAILPE
jgi:hypothetical protein